MWRSCMTAGMSPDQFWDSTLAEVLLFLNAKKEKQVEQWYHTASLMSLYANSKASKGRKFSPDDFHPYIAMEKAVRQPKTKEDVLAIVDKFKNFNG